jgi:hypothetical protein
MVNLLKYVNIPVFIIAFALGIFAVYITTDMRTVFVFPTPENVDLIQYRDKTGACFSYKQSEVGCPKDDKDISIIPAQE